MAVLYKDLIDGNEATLTIDGWTINRTAIVDRLSGYLGYQKLIAATQYLNTEGAYIGAQHPAWPTAYLISINPVSIDNDTIKFSFVYKENPPVSITLNTALSQESTNIDATGTKIELEYTYPTDYKDPNTGATSQLSGKTIKQGGTVMKYIPEIGFSYTRTEAVTGMQLIEKKKLYEGKINSSNWTLGGVNQEKWRWLCTGITGDSQDGGINYVVTYSFSYRKGSRIYGTTGDYSGWRPFVVFVRVDGNPAPDVLDDPIQYDAYKNIPLYEEVDFNPLNIV
jgi:hypothetical protein